MAYKERKENLKNLIQRWISVFFIISLSACSSLAAPGSPTQSPVLNSLVTMPTQTAQVDTRPTQAGSETLPTPTSTPGVNLLVPNTPVWVAYSYTCELATGGGTMTMHLSWADRSNSEDGYEVYRDKQVIATLTPNSTVYVDTVFVAAGKSISYSVEAFNSDWRTSTSIITSSCQ
jgi:hypothetical protein